MENLFNFILLSTASTGCFYVLYLILLKRNSSFQFNRIYLLMTLMFSAVIPFLQINPGGFQEMADVIPSFSIPAVNVSYSAEQSTGLFMGANMAGIIYVIIVAIMVLLFVGQWIHVSGLKKKIPSKIIHGTRIFYTEGNLPHFSFFRSIFINTSEVHHEEQLDRVIKHEKAHVNQLHSLDILLLEILKALMWFNPFVWLYRGLMTMNHEYLADEKVARSENSLYDYLQHLVENSLITYKYSIVNNFNHSLIKKRIAMMRKEKNKLLSTLRIIMVIPIALATVVVISCAKDSDAEGEKAAATEMNGVEVVAKLDQSNVPLDEEVFRVVEVMPGFDGGTFEKFRSFIQKNVMYPKVAKENNKQGKVFVTFVVDSKGNVRDVKVVRGVDPSLDAEALRVVSESPKWIPGKQRGKNVAVQFTFPINFSLQ